MIYEAVYFILISIFIERRHSLEEDSFELVKDVHIRVNLIEIEVWKLIVHELGSKIERTLI